jgi:glycosyltransferase involved in cell wall biosynthesis
VEKLAADPTLARRLGAAGYERIASRYTYERLAREYSALLGRLYGEGRQ